MWGAGGERGFTYLALAPPRSANLSISKQSNNAASSSIVNNTWFSRKQCKNAAGEMPGLLVLVVIIEEEEEEEEEEACCCCWGYRSTAVDLSRVPAPRVPFVSTNFLCGVM